MQGHSFILKYAGVYRNFVKVAKFQYAPTFDDASIFGN